MGSQEEKEKTTFSKESSFSADSYYDESLFAYVGFEILYFLMGLLSAGLLSPLAIQLSALRRVKHTVINGKRLCFNGKIHQIYGRFVVWVFLSLATLFIYTFFVGVEIRKWITKHTFFENEVKEGTSVYLGDPYESMIVNSVALIFKIGSLGILTPKVEAVQTEMITKRCVYSGHRLLYIGGFDGVMGFGFRNVLLTICSLGFYQMVKGFNIEEWTARRVVVDDGRKIDKPDSPIYKAINTLMIHKKWTLVIFGIIVLAALAGIICFYVFWHGSIQGFIVFGAGVWLFAYSAFFSANAKK